MHPKGETTERRDEAGLTEAFQTCLLWGGGEGTGELCVRLHEHILSERAVFPISVESTVKGTDAFDL